MIIDHRRAASVQIHSENSASQSNLCELKLGKNTGHEAQKLAGTDLRAEINNAVGVAPLVVIPRDSLGKMSLAGRLFQRIAAQVPESNGCLSMSVLS